MATGKLIPPLVGVAEAAEILGWRKQKIATYLGRAEKYREELRAEERQYLPPDIFPEPIQRLASGPIWTRKQIEEYRETRKPNESHG